MTRFYCFMILPSLFPLFLSAQKSTSDTIVLKEVEIRGHYPTLPGIRKINISETALQENLLNDVSDVVRTLPSLHVRSSGPGSSSLAYIRGAGASHTNVTWNGILLNSPMTGQADLSLVPSLFPDDIMLLAGNNSSFSRSPAIGGTLCIENEPSWKSPNKAGLMLSAGSFGNYSGGIIFSRGNQKVISRLRLYGKMDENRFPYMNNAIIPQEKMIRTDAGMTNGSAQHELFLKKRKTQYSLITWAGIVNREIPALITNVTAAKHIETQNDRFVRICGSAEWNKRTLSLFIKPSFNASELRYKLIHSTTGGSITSSDSRSLEHAIGTHQGIDLRLRRTILRTGNSVSLQEANVTDLKYNSGYDHRQCEAIHYLNIEQPIGRYFRFLGAARAGWAGSGWMPPSPAVHFYYRPLNQNLPVFYVSAGKNYRWPSLNDLYFIPGGNPDLKHEKSISYEAGIEDCIFKIAGSCLNLNLTVFYQEIDDWIIWQPSQYGFWQPFNIRNATSAGYTCSADWVREFTKGKILFSSQYTYNVANARDEAYETGQPVYLPVHNIYTQIAFHYGKWKFTTNAQFMSERKTSLYKNTWSPELEPVWVQNVSAGRSFAIGKTNLNIGLRSENIFNVQWQQIMWRPMPGRSFLITLSFEM